MLFNIAYCIFCKKSKESKVAKYFNLLEEEIVAIAPTKVLYEKRQGSWVSKEVSLIPNYVFVYANDNIDIKRISKLSDAYRPIQYDDGQRELAGKDLEYALWIHKNQGKIEVTKYIQWGETIKVVEGPLTDHIGIIQKMDKHKRRIWVSFDFAGQSRVVALSAECIALA